MTKTVKLAEPLEQTPTSARLWPPQECKGCGKLTINAISIEGKDAPYCHCCVLERDIREAFDRQFAKAS